MAGGYNGPTNGPHGASSSAPHVFDIETFVGAGSTFTVPLQASGMPGLRVWVYQSAGAGLVTILPQYANGNIAGNQPGWVPLSAPYAVAALVPSLVSFPLGARMFRISISSTGAATVQWRLTASLT